MNLDDFSENTQGLIDKSCLLETSYAMSTDKQNASGWENLTCYCKNQKEIPNEPFGYLTTIKNKVKFVTFLRKCKECGKLRGNFEESKPREDKGVTL